MIEQLEDLGSLLIEAEGALALERDRRTRAESDLALVQGTLMRLLRSAGVDVIARMDRREPRLACGLADASEMAVREEVTTAE